MASNPNESETCLERDFFRRNALIIIDEMLELSKIREDTTKLVDEVLHSIFFLGAINDPPYTPEMILDQRLEEVKALYPEPFRRYSSQLPRRSPFSCVLDMLVHLIGQENEKDIQATLQELILDLRDGTRSKCLFSFAICISQASENSVRHYGVSMSTSSKQARQIMVAASCCASWDEYVAGAVMTYFPNKKKTKRKDRLTDIDGTIRLPENVRCEAFSLNDGREIPPCMSCATLFHLQTTGNQVFPYGNCAEPESLSNLLRNETQVRENVQLHAPDLWTCENKREAKNMVSTHLKNLLKSENLKNVFRWDGKFYSPQRARKVSYSHV